MDANTEMLKLNVQYKNSFLAFLASANDHSSELLQKEINFKAFERGIINEVPNDQRKAFIELFSVIYYEVRPHFEGNPEKLHLLDLLHQLTVVARLSYMSMIPNEIFNLSNNNVEGASNLSTFITNFVQD